MQRNAAWAIAIALGAAGLGLQLAPASLAPAASCPGMLESIAVAGAQIARDAPLGAWLAGADRLLFFIAIVLFGRAAVAVSGSWLAASAVTLAFAASPLFAPALSVLDPAVAVAAGVAAVAAVSGRGAGKPAARWALALAAAAMVLAIPLFRLPDWLVPPLPPESGVAAASCVGSFALGRAGAVFSAAGRYALLLAALGLFMNRRRLIDRRAWPLFALAAGAFLIAAISPANAARAQAPATVVVWLVAGAGLAEVVRAAGTSPAGRVGALLLAGLLPFVPVAARYRQPRATPTPAVAFGHGGMTLAGFRRALQALPDKSALVAEDAGTDLLLRASGATWQRSGKALRLVDGRPLSVAAASADESWHVFAPPVAQSALPLLGFHLSDDAVPGLSGFSLVRNGVPCSDVGESWRAVDFQGAPMLVIRSEDRAEEGAVAIWLGSARPINVMPFGWPAWVTPGFLPAPYGSSEHDRMLQDAVGDGLTGGEPLFREPNVVRLEVWKMPEAPELLPILLGADPPSTGLIHATPGVTLQTCAGYVHTVHPISLPR